MDLVSKRRRVLLPTSTFKWGESNTFKKRENVSTLTSEVDHGMMKIIEVLKAILSL